MKDAFLQAVSSILSIISDCVYFFKEDCNVILTRWSPANYFPYTKAAANAQIVGVDIALLVNKTISSYGADSADFHIIAHSLGAAVAGYAGKRISKLGRITGSFSFLSFYFSCLYFNTGLDPASPLFEDTDPIVHLYPTDAQFVDIIHTDGTPVLQLGFGQYDIFR